jgi:hypothetical protein
MSKTIQDLLEEEKDGPLGKALRIQREVNSLEETVVI